MSQIIDAVRRLGIIAQQEDWLKVSDVYRNDNNCYFKQIKESFLGHLTKEEIDQITNIFPFELSQEMYDLYQTGNGHFPFDVSKIQEYNYYKDMVNYYYFFIIQDEPLYSLQESIELIKNISLNESFCNNYLLLPLCSFENGLVLATTLEKEKKDTSPIYLIDDTLVYKFYQDNLSQNDLFPDEMWPSLTNMMLAYAQLYEKKDSPESIYLKYGSNHKNGLSIFF